MFNLASLAEAIKEFEKHAPPLTNRPHRLQLLSVKPGVRAVTIYVDSGKAETVSVFLSRPRIDHLGHPVATRFVATREDSPYWHLEEVDLAHMGVTPYLRFSIDQLHRWNPQVYSLINATPAYDTLQLLIFAWQKWLKPGFPLWINTFLNGW